VSPLNSGWYVRQDNYLLEPIAPLPQEIEAAPGEAVRIHHPIRDDHLDGQTLLIRGSLADVTVFLDDRLLYERIYDRPGLPSMPMVSAWHLVDLPDAVSGKMLTITYTSPFERMSGILNEVHYGNRGALLQDLLADHAWSLGISSMILFIGGVMILSSFLFPDQQRRDLRYIGLFASLLSLWMLAETRALQLFVSSQLVLGGLAYLCLSLFPVPLLRYLEEMVLPRSARVLSTLRGLFLLNTVVIVILQFTGIAGFFATVIFTHLLVFISILAITHSLLKERREHPENELALRFGRAILILFPFGLLELINFYWVGPLYTSVFTHVGILLFVMVLAIGSAKRLVLLYERSYEALFFQRMAYRDRLTGGGNRMAFAEEIESRFKEPDGLSGLRLAVFDLNNLKEINDTHGHVVGDDAINRAYACIEGAFSDQGTCYRIGGDEFACVLPDSQESAFRNALVKLHRLVREEDGKVDYAFGLASGGVIYHPELDLTAEKMLHRADLEMYAKKRQMKRRATD
jgi:diguanylate cyclase (GGDEF)-like protein